MTGPLRTASFTFEGRDYEARYRTDGSGGIEDLSVWTEGRELLYVLPEDASLDEAAVNAALKDLEAEQDSARYDYEETEER